MNIAALGASSMVRSRLILEAMHRGHHAAYARNNHAAAPNDLGAGADLRAWF